jgi:tetratricopeptide (TPR) repeat protein
MNTKTYILATLGLLLSMNAAANPAWQQSYTLEASGNYAGAANEMTLVLQQSPTHELALMRRAWLRYLQAQYNAAIDDYKRVLIINTKSIDARLGLTLPLMAQLRWQEAAVEARKVIAVSNWNYTAHLHMLVCEEALQQWETLARHATELSAHYPSDASALVYLARAEAWQGHIELAKLAYGKVLELMPTHAEALAYLNQN